MHVSRQRQAVLRGIPRRTEVRSESSFQNCSYCYMAAYIRMEALLLPQQYCGIDPRPESTKFMTIQCVEFIHVDKPSLTGFTLDQCIQAGDCSVYPPHIASREETIWNAGEAT